MTGHLSINKAIYSAIYRGLDHKAIALRSVIIGVTLLFCGKLLFINQ